MTEPTSMSEEHANAVLAVVAADRKLPQLNDKREIVATAAEAEEIARRVYWRTQVRSPQGLAHLFPGLTTKRGAERVPRKARS